MGITLGTMLRKKRMRAALSMDEVAMKSGLSKPFISLVETKGAKMSKDAACRLAAVLGLNGEELAARYWLQRVPSDLWPALFDVMAEALAPAGEAAA